MLLSRVSRLAGRVFNWSSPELGTETGFAWACRSIYAVLAVSLFREKSPIRFGSFSKALFTMLQIGTGDVSLAPCVRWRWICC
eukprot:1036246-Rhodomonas_salina.1